MLQSLHKVRIESQNLANVFTGSISVSFFCEKDRLRKKCSQICEHLVSLQIVSWRNKFYNAWKFTNISVTVWPHDPQGGKHNEEYFIEKSFLETFADSA